jgi:hypothetical protein
VSLAPARRLTFPDQQQNFQNAAEHRITSECDREIKFPSWDRCDLGSQMDMNGLLEPIDKLLNGIVREPL